MQIGLMSLQDELAKEVAGFGASLAKKAPHSELVTEGTDSRPMPQYQKPAEYSAMQDALVQELGAFLGASAGEGGPRARLSKVSVNRPVPWQNAIADNPQGRLKRTGKIQRPDGMSRALTGLEADGVLAPQA